MKTLGYHFISQHESSYHFFLSIILLFLAVRNSWYSNSIKTLICVIDFDKLEKVNGILNKKSLLINFTNTVQRCCPFHSCQIDMTIYKFCSELLYRRLWTILCQMNWKGSGGSKWAFCRSFPRVRTFRDNQSRKYEWRKLLRSDNFRLSGEKYILRNSLLNRGNL